MKQEKKLEEAKRLYKTANADQRYVLESLFPELKESKYEKNIKDLIDELKCSLRAANCQNEACNGGHEKRIALLEWAIAWVEKQGKINGETTFQVWKDMRLEVYTQASGNRHEPNCSNDCTKMFSLCDIDEIILNITEKQGEQKPKKVSIWKHWKDGIAGNGEGKQTYLIKNGLTYSISSCLGYECDYIELSELDKLMREEKPKWSKENEEEFKIAIETLHEAGQHSSAMWLKSLKQRLKEQQ